jgi:hypothetical protein
MNLYLAPIQTEELEVDETCKIISPKFHDERECSQLHNESQK